MLLQTISRLFLIFFTVFLLQDQQETCSHHIQNLGIYTIFTLSFLLLAHLMFTSQPTTLHLSVFIFSVSKCALVWGIIECVTLHSISQYVPHPIIFLISCHIYQQTIVSMVSMANVFPIPISWGFMCIVPWFIVHYATYIGDKIDLILWGHLVGYIVGDFYNAIDQFYIDQLE